MKHHFSEKIAKHAWRDQDLGDLLPFLPTESSTPGLEPDPVPALLLASLVVGCVSGARSVGSVRGEAGTGVSAAL